MNEPDEAELKVQINNFIWMHAPGHLCMKHAETLACTFLSLLNDAAGRHSQELWEPLKQEKP